MHEIQNTWLFVNVSSGFEGKTTIHKKVPDTITSWIITGFAIDPITGFGMTQTPRKLEVFQPFFVSTNLPYSIKRGETVAIPIVVFNYMNEDVEAEVTLDNSLHEFEFADISNDVVDTQKTLTSKSKRVRVKSNNGASVSFMVRPTKVGHITIKVVATSPNAGDGVERQLLVEPEGVTQYVNKGFFADLRENPEFTTEIPIDVPRNAIPDSTRIEFSAIGDILGSTIKNLDKLIKLPSGCGEQNMLNFVPNIVILDYLAASNKVTPAIKAKSIGYMEQGYQRELTYKHPDGSYSAFGGSGKGSTWLTAFVAKSFRQAAKYIDIDEKVMESAFEYLKSVQAPNGSFPEAGTVFHKGMQGGGGNGLALTAYVLCTFLESPKDAATYRNTIDKGIEYLLQNIDKVDDIYSLAVTAYALQLADHSSKTSVLQTLQSKAKTQGGQTWWEKPITGTEKKNPYYGEPNSVNVELSSYGLLTFMATDSMADAIPVMKWLIGQRNEEGGFSSTQDTVVGIGALAKIATKLTTANNNVQFVAKYNDNEEVTMNVNNENAGILQSREIPSSVRKLQIKGTGHGFGIGQVSYKYNVNVTAAWPRFNLDPQVNKNSNQDYLHLTVCTSYIPNAAENDLKSSMAVMEVKFPSGFTADPDTLPSLEKSQGVQKVETKDGDTVVVMYFNNLDASELCPTITGFRTFKVANQKPAPVTVYDYYDNSRRARQFYNAQQSTLCDICEGTDCGDSCTPKTAEQISPLDNSNSRGPLQKSSAPSLMGGSVVLLIAALLKQLF